MEVVDIMLEEMERCMRLMEVEEMVRGWRLERWMESYAEKEKNGEDGNGSCGSVEVKREVVQKEKKQRNVEDMKVWMKMKKSKERIEVRRGRCTGDSREKDKKRDTEESKETGGAVGEEIEIHVSGEGQGEGGGSRKGKKLVEKMDGKCIRAAESMGGRRKEKEKRKDRVGVGSRNCQERNGESFEGRS